MSFKAKLDIGGTEYKVYKVDYSISRSVDEMGRLTSSVVGGQISIELKSTEDNLFFEHICSSEKISAGTITFNKRNEDATMRKLEFKQAYVASYNEVFDHTGLLGTMILSITLVAKVIKMGDADLGNDYFEYALNR